MAWVNPVNISVGDLVTAARWNQDVVDNVEWLARDHWRAAITRTVSQSYANGAEVMVDFDATVYDFGGMVNLTSNTLTIPSPFPTGITTALFRFKLSLSWAPNNVGLRYASIWRSIGGALTELEERDARVSANESGQHVEADVLVTPGQSFIATALQSSGGALNLTGANDANFVNQPLFSARWLAWQD